MQINLEYYKIFYYVAQTGQFTAAAEQLSLSQPAVSQSVKNLETQLQTSLFTRTAKGVRLTPEGEVLYAHVAKGYELIRLGTYKITQMLNLEAGEIRIGASDMTLQFYLLPYLELFHQQYPRIKVSVTNGPTPETVTYLREGAIDFGIVSTPVPHAEGLQTDAVKEIKDIFIAGKNFAHLKDHVISYQELAKLPFICLEQSTSTRTNLDQMMAEKNIILQPEFELATSDMIVQFAIRNLGIGYVMSEFAQEYIRRGLLFQLQLPDSCQQRQFCIITDKHTRLSNAAAKLLEILLSNIPSD